VATVSRVLNNQPKVSKRTREAVHAAMKRLGYTPNAVARSLSRSRTDTIGVIFRQIASGFYADVMCGIEMECRARGLHMLITTSDRSAPQRLYDCDQMGEARVDGVIVLDSTMDRETISRVRSFGRPLVMIQNRCGEASASTVSTADEQGAYLALKHLLSLGYRRLLLISGPPAAEDSSLRIKGCQRALAEFQVSEEEAAMIIGHYSSQEALASFREYRARRGLPRAIFAFNDDMALAVMKELRGTGVGVPEEVAVVGFDGLDAADFMGLTTVRIPMMEMGKQAVGILAERMADPDRNAAHIILPCELIVRGSSGRGHVQP
jgi:LacI family transcriptional regulator